jgi:DNA-binding CsgD family transcriptional regulator
MGDLDLTELQDALAATIELTSEASAVPLDEVTDFASAGTALRDAWEIVHRTWTGPAAGDARGLDLFPLADRLRRIDCGVREAESRRRLETLHEIGPALRRLQAMGSSGDLLAKVPEVICALGFDRGIVSSVVDARWVTRASHVIGDAEWGALITRTGQDEPAPLRGTRVPESEVVRRRRPMVVLDVQRAPHVHAPMARASLARSYVVAPVIVGSDVVGLVHADRVFHRGDTDVVDRDVLAMFADGLSLAFERASLEARLTDLQSGLRHLAGGATPPPDLQVSADPLAQLRAPVEAVARPERRATATDVLVGRLTRRELRIIRHLAQGETNEQIAARLVLSRDTVKTHVKHILRKLGASNRAEAVANWLLADAPPR